MRVYTPDFWCILSITRENQTIKKILCGRYGGFSGQDTWRLSTPIKNTSKINGGWKMITDAGSVYHCMQTDYRLSTLTRSALVGIKMGTDAEIVVDNIDTLLHNSDH